MIELPEAYCLAAEIGELAGRRISAVQALQSPHKFAFFSGDAAAYPELLAGQRIVGARPFGGLVFIDLDEHTLVLGDGAFPRYTAAGAKPPAKHQLRLDLDDGSVLTVTVRMYGGIHLLEWEEDNQYLRAARERPNPLDAGFDATWVAGLWSGEGVEKLSVKAFLATGQRIPGIGNGVVQDVAWRASCNPRTRVAYLPAAQRKKLMSALKETVRLMCEAGGRNSEPRLDGTPGGYHAIASSATTGTPCPRCGSLIVKENFLGGSIYFCPSCQPKP